MKLWKKISLGLLVLVVLTQIPFIYTRFHTGNLARKVSELKTPKLNSENQKYVDYKGIVHVHSFLGGHSSGSFEDLIESANDNQLDFVIMTEHSSKFFDTSEKTLRGFYGKTLFVGGNEVNAKNGEHLLVVEGFSGLHNITKSTIKETLPKIRSNNSLAFVTYPKKFKSWNENVDGVEVFNLHSNGKKISKVSLFFDYFWSYGAYPELTLARYLYRPDENLQKFDEVTKTHKLTLLAGSDAHSNMGFHLFGSDANKKYIRIKVDEYRIIFRLIRTHILLEKDEKFNKENLFKALKKGRTFTGVDVLVDTSGFSFFAETDDEIKTMGDEVLLENGAITLKSNTPQNARFVLFKNGEKVFESKKSNKMKFEVKEKGTYRIEAFLDSLGSPFDKMPWIISNPIYIK